MIRRDHKWDREAVETLWCACCVGDAPDQYAAVEVPDEDTLTEEIREVVGWVRLLKDVVQLVIGECFIALVCNRGTAHSQVSVLVLLVSALL